MSHHNYVKWENNLRCLSFDLKTSSHYFLAAESLLKDRWEEFTDLKPLLPQVDRSLEMSQILLVTLANYTLDKRQDIFASSTFSEALH